MITSVTNNKVKKWMKLKVKKYRDSENMFIVEGMHMLEEAIKASCVDTIITTDKNYKSKYPIEVVSEEVISKLAFTKTPQPYMAICYKKDNILNKEGKRFLLLDNVQDPGNVGTMIRCALAFNYDQVILSNDSCDLYNDKTLRSTQGAIFKMNVIRKDLKETINELEDVVIVGTSLKDAKPIDEIEIEEKMAFIMGNEGQGMKDELLALCDKKLYIPISTMESLNVGVASGIVMNKYRG